MAFDSSSEFSGSTRIPVSPSFTVNGMPCDLVEITGFLNANDSSGTSGDNSHCEGRTKNSLSPYAEITSSRGGFLIT